MNRFEQISTLRPIVFYDGECPLCVKEIIHYRRQRGADGIDWMNIHQSAAALSAYGLTLDQTMKCMHVRDERGRWQTGAAAFVTLWSNLPRYRWMSRIGGIPVIQTLAEQLYRFFAARRYQSRCRNGYCALPSEADQNG